MENLLPRYLLNEMGRQPKPVPLEVHAAYDLYENVQIQVTASKDGARGTGIVVIDGLVALVARDKNRNAFMLALEKELQVTADRALSAHLQDHEMQQGWPARECMHDHVDGAEVAA